MRISGKICALGVASVAFAAVAIVAVVLLEKAALQPKLEQLIRDQGQAEAAKIAQSCYAMCVSSDARTLRRLNYNLGLARELLDRDGPPRLATETVTWEAVNQVSKQSVPVTLPKFLLKDTWLGQNRSTNAPSALVDQIRHYTRDQATIFQRMNEAGDMLRVATSVVGADGQRAIGTFIPRRNPDGTESAVINTVLRGETFHGRAMVVNEWHATAYEPIWDSQRRQVIGMLFVGVGLNDVSRDARQNILAAKVGTSGYVYILGAKGDQRGKYLISKDGARDGENIWESKDADGKPFIQSLVTKALGTTNGSVAFESYTWKNAGEATARRKFVAATYYEPWDWVIGAGTYEDDYRATMAVVAAALRRMIWWVVAAGAATIGLAFGVGLLVSRGIARPIYRLIQQLTGTAQSLGSASTQVAHASQTLADGASAQAAALEETSASLEEMSSMTQRNAETAGRVRELGAQARAAGDVAMGNIQALDSAMDAIKSSGSEITKIVKTIDEIAFQTNILALNAAVEAARAGGAGAGFAVVADEVRRLAQRCAEAAKETAVKVEDAVQKSARGADISVKVAQSLREIVGKARQVDELAGHVADASREQSQGIAQVNTSVSQMVKVTQANAASAEESASAAVEMTSQAEALKQAVTELIALVGSGQATAPVIRQPSPGNRPPAPPRPPTPARPAARPAPARPEVAHA